MEGLSHWRYKAKRKKFFFYLTRVILIKIQTKVSEKNHYKSSKIKNIDNENQVSINE